MKIVFADVDGVLVNRQSFRLPRMKCASIEPTVNTAFPACVRNLNRIIKETQAKIVISSTWRLLGVKAMREIFERWGVEGDIIGRTPELRGSDRGIEIEQWLATCGHDIESFVILDDDADMNGLSARLVQTNFTYGLTARDATRAIELLKAA